jgi:hypothetical protein
VWTVVLSAAVPFFGQRAGAQETLSLTPKWTIGRTTYVEMRWETDAVTSFKLLKGTAPPPEPKRVKSEQTFGFLHQPVESLPDGGARILLTIDRVQVAVDDPTQRMSFDSDADEPKDESKAFRLALLPLIGVPMTMKVDATGKVTSLSGLADAVKKAKEACPDETCRGYLAGVLDEGWYSFIWGQFYGLYAFKDVRVGDTWNRSLPFQGQAFDSTYKLDRTTQQDQRSLAVITYSSNWRQTYTPKPATMPAGARPPWATSEPAPTTKPSVSSSQPTTSPATKPTTSPAEEPVRRIEGTAFLDVQQGEIVNLVENSESEVHWPVKDDRTGSYLGVSTKVTATQTLMVVPEAQRLSQKQNRQSAKSKTPGK